ncbi:Nuclear fragile X mental retardation-interacting protein 1, conserved domain protein [Quillaja saponaria]|uniref:Nuclear fragile X mental retardation-interacting protein 1, conserved domain protein n=1 Tax=Quillaja saponaria TaxID=32244 RepID=A0AAD7QII5_QUISA|nr:Nuclear fragile X mental retardation-interacting protein 1, conserved domain protein [Quillaja saponaria]
MSNRSSMTQSGFVNASNQLLPSQNSNLGMPHLGSVGSTNMIQTSMQTQPQPGPNNHQNSMPYMPNMQPSIPQAAFMNAANNFLGLQMQSSLLGLPHMSSVGPTTQLSQFNMGFGPQNGANYMNCIPTSPFHGQITQNAAQMNLPQPLGQLFLNNFLSIPQQHNLNMNIPNGQYCAPVPLQNMNQNAHMQVTNPSQVLPFALPHPMLGVPNQFPQGIVPQNLNFSANAQFGRVHCNQFSQQVNQNQKNLVLPKVDANALKSSPVASQQLQGSNYASCNYNSKPSEFTMSQCNPINNSRINIPNSNWKGSPSKNFKSKRNREAFQGGSQKSKLQNTNNAKRNFGFPKEHKGKGLSNGRAGKLGPVNSSNQAKELKRSSSVIYTKQEVQQWREARRKNYPSKANSEKRNKKLEDYEVDKEAKLRREQLKEILAKQAELGVEVAEIPSSYLLDSEKQAFSKQEKRKEMSKKGGFQNKFDRRGRYDKRNRYAKKQRLSVKDLSEGPTLNKRDPTLLQKLLSADIRRDKSCLLQVLRFMTMNSFFEGWPDKPLQYPSVVVKDIGDEGNDKNKYIESRKNVCETMLDNDNIGNYVGKDKDEDGNEDNDCDEDIAQDDEESYTINRECGNGKGIEEPDEEEGEIID